MLPVIRTKRRITLSPEERHELEMFTKTGKRGAKSVKRAAVILALACGTPPEGYAAWTLRLLADTCVKLQYVDALSHMTVSRLLKKHNIPPL
jgi:hypothetical protein